MNNLILWGGLAVAVVGALLFEDSRDWIVDTLTYIFSFEWFGDFFGFLGELFEGIGEFSITGLILGIVGLATIYLARDYMLKPFLMYMSPMEAMFWGVATYVGTFIAGYLLGKGFDNTG